MSSGVHHGTQLYLDDELLECAICLGACKGAEALRCGHRFHLQCLAAWTLSAAANCAMCPSCRTDIIDPAEKHTSQFCARCSVSLRRSTETLLWGANSANIWCTACTTREFVQNIRQRLCSIYAEHNPRKLDDVDGLLGEWLGEEDALLANVEKKYGMDGRLEVIRAEVFQIYTQCNPRKLVDIDELLVQGQGEEEQLLVNIRRKLKKELLDAVDAIRRQLLALYTEHSPQEVRLLRFNRLFHAKMACCWQIFGS